MTDKKRKTIIIVLAVLVVIISGFLGWYLSNKNTTDMEGAIIEKNKDLTYSNKLLKTYDEYQALLKEYNILGKLEKKDFEEYDYLVDFIPYMNNMVIENIVVDKTDKGINITYKLNKEKKDTNKLFVNFIPINKNTITDVTNVKQIFN